MPSTNELALACGQAMIDAETKADEALAAAADALALFARGRIQASISATSGHAVFERMRNGINHAVELRGALVDSHNRLEAVRRLHGIDAPTLIGSVDKPPQDAPNPMMSSERALRVVAKS
jgi:hypothetical protein